MSVPAVLPRQSRKKCRWQGMPNSYVFQSKFRFFDIDREKPWKPGEGSSIFEERHLIPLVFIAKQFFFIVLRHRSWGNLRWAWKTHSIEYNSSFFWGTPPNSIGFYCKVGFSHCSTAPVVGVPFGELKKIIFLIQYEKKLIISGDIRNYIFWHQPWKTMKTKGRFILFLWNTT